jgi:hypothetical protein
MVDGFKVFDNTLRVSKNLLVSGSSNKRTLFLSSSFEMNIKIYYRAESYSGGTKYLQSE